MKVSDWPIQRKLLSGVLLTSGVVLAITSGLFLIYELAAFRDAMVNNMTTLSRVIATNSTAAFAFDNKDDATSVLSALAAEPSIEVSALYDARGDVFATYGELAQLPTLVPADGYHFTRSELTMYQPVTLTGRRLGTVFVQSNLRALYARLFVFGGIVVLLLVLAFLVGLWLARELQGYITRPVLALVRTATSVSIHRDYSARAVRYGNDELGELTDVFNAMMAQIENFNASLEKRVIERTAELQTANKALDSYSYTVSHDLRAPLRHIQGFGQLLRREADGAECQLSDKAAHFLDTILKASADMGHLVDDLLTFSRMGRAELRTGTFALDDLVKEVIAEMEVEGRTIEWVVGPLPFVVGDKAMIALVLRNLIGNAVKYSRKRALARIEINTTGEEKGRAIVAIKDNGAGFDQRYADKLFGVFQRLHRADEFEGTGIGLATVQQIITRHGGRAWGVGEVDKGATFSFTIETVAKEVDELATNTTV